MYACMTFYLLLILSLTLKSSLFGSIFTESLHSHEFIFILNFSKVFFIWIYGVVILGKLARFNLSLLCFLGQPLNQTGCLPPPLQGRSSNAHLRTMTKPLVYSFVESHSHPEIGVAFTSDHSTCVDAYQL